MWAAESLFTPFASAESRMRLASASRSVRFVSLSAAFRCDGAAFGTDPTGGAVCVCAEYLTSGGSGSTRIATISSGFVVQRFM
jgi:hypothetical protein